jgi:hypothetical protein
MKMRLFLKRCVDTYEDDRGLIIPITDEDLIKALTVFPEQGVQGLEKILAAKFEQIVL